MTRADDNLIFLLEGDGESSKDLRVTLEGAGYQLQSFTDLGEFGEACGQVPLRLLLMDVAPGDAAVAAFLARYRAKAEAQGKTIPPVVFISQSDHFRSRLAAARLGVSHYFCKPLDMQGLTEAVSGLLRCEVERPYRVLFIDDDEVLLERYASVLRETGMEVETLLDPAKGLQRLAAFKPELLILGVHLSECSGLELAQVIRQDPARKMVPIIYLSTEQEFHHQLAVMNLDEADFLIKPVSADCLRSAAAVRLKRSRWRVRLNRALRASLRESESLNITVNQHGIVSSADVAGRIIGVNDKFCEISGYSREELLGQNHRLVKSDYHADHFYADMWIAISRGKVWHGIICNRKKDGSEYWVDSTIVPFLDEAGKPYKYVSVRTDITALRSSQERLVRSQEFANIGTWDWNIKTGELFWSDRIAPLFGYDKETTETSYENFLAAIHPDDRQMVMDAVNDCVEKGHDYHVEHRVRWADGSVHWVSESGNVVRDDNGVPLHMLGVVQDIDARKQAEQVLAESKRQLLEAQRLASIGNWQANLSSGELSWSDEIYRIFGHQPGSFAPSVEVFHAAVHPDDLAKVRESEKTAAQTGRHDVVHRIIRPDGSVRHVHELAQAEFDSEGNLVTLAGTVQDVTEQKEAQQALLMAKEEAESANRAKSQFLSSMSHELRTPMNAIMGFGQLLKMEREPELTESQAENVNEIVKAGGHLLQLINEVLDLARIEAGHIELSIETVAQGEVIAEVLQLMMPLAQKRGIEISLHQGGVDIGVERLADQHAAVRADRTRFRQILLNLLSNAVKYNREQGRIIITCDHTPEQRTRISITDTGCGLSVEQQAEIFTAFNRLGAESSGIEGTGIGLVICKSLVELMGGDIGVDSRPGEGSTFWFELPSDTLPAAQSLPQDDVPEQADVVLSPESPSHSVDDCSVLYIEDNPANLRLVSQLLGRLNNVRMWSAHESMLGLELAAEHRPDLILLDINLPGMDGFGVLEHLRHREATRNTPVIAISANAMPKDIEKGRQAGFDDYITKPIDVKHLLQVVESRLGEIRIMRKDSGHEGEV